MVRVDVFTKDGKYFLVPIYTWQVAKGILPNKAVIQGKDEEDWENMDDNVTFQFSLHQNDLVKLVTKRKLFWVTLMDLIVPQVILILKSMI